MHFTRQPRPSVKCDNALNNKEESLNIESQRFCCFDKGMAMKISTLSIKSTVLATALVFLGAGAAYAQGYSSDQAESPAPYGESAPGSDVTDKDSGYGTKGPGSGVNMAPGARAGINMVDHIKARAGIRVMTYTIIPISPVRVPISEAGINNSYYITPVHSALRLACLPCYRVSA